MPENQCLKPIPVVNTSHRPCKNAGWENPPHDIREQEYFTDGRGLPIGDGEVAVRGERKFADYILYYQRDFKLTVVEAKEETLPAKTGMQQAGVIIARQRPPTARGTAFIALEDEGGVVDVILQPGVFAAYREVLCGWFAVIEGTLRRRGRMSSMGIRA